MTYATRGGDRSAGLVLAWGATETGETPALPEGTDPGVTGTGETPALP